MNQANLLKVAAVTIAIPRFAGAFALSAGFVAEGSLHTGLGVAEIVAGVSMAVLEGFALAFILNKWRLLRVCSLGWYSLLAVICLLALSLPLVAIPYLYFMQAGFSSVNALFSSVWLQNCWNFVVAGVPMLVVIGVGLADVNELEREQKQIDFQLEVSKKKAMLDMEVSEIELKVEQAIVLNELGKRRLRAQYKADLSKAEAQAKRGVSKNFVCECGQAFERSMQLNGHKAHCRKNGQVELIK